MRCVAGAAWSASEIVAVVARVVVVIERAGRAGLIEEREKLFATLVVMFPRIFPVKDDGDGDLFLRRVVNDLA